MIASAIIVDNCPDDTELIFSALLPGGLTSRQLSKVTTTVNSLSQSSFRKQAEGYPKLASHHFIVLLLDLSIGCRHKRYSHFPRMKPASVAMSVCSRNGNP
jgi:hypothetical protein